MNIGYTGLLSLIFVAAKVFGFITWSWIWVFAPLWITLTVVGGLALIVFVVAALVG